MAQETIPTKAEIVSMLKETGSEGVAKLRSLPAGVWEQGRYENGWNARQILAHIASIEWAYPRLIDVARDAASPTPADSGAAASGSGAAQGGIDDYNTRQVAKRADASVTDLISEFEANRAKTVEAVAAADDSLFTVPIRSAGGVSGPLASVLNYIAVLHVAQHIKDIAGQDA